MTDLEELATSNRDVIRPEDAENVPYRLEDTDSTEADEISAEGEFPQFGEFLDVTALNGGAGDLGPRWLECPGGLARELVEAGLAEDGAEFQILGTEKDDTGAWTFDLEEFDA